MARIDFKERARLRKLKILSEPKACSHHWLIEEPSGRHFVSGKCKLCGEIKQFRIYPDE